MRVPTLTLQFPRLALDWFADLGGRRLLLYALYTLVLFVAFLFVNFPYQDLVQRTLRDTDLGGVTVDVGATRFAWWKGFELRDVRLTERGAAAGTTPLLEASALYARPSLSNLIRGQFKAMHLEGAMYQGTVDADVAVSDGMTRVTLDLRGLDLARYRMVTALLEQGQIGGRISGAISFEIPPTNPAAGQAAGELEIKSASVSGMTYQKLPVPDLHFPAIVLKFALRGGRLEVQELHADGNEVRVSGSGQITVRDPLPESVLNLKLTVQPGPQGSDVVAAFLNLLPRPAKPDAPISLTGTLAQPRVR